jgi:putative ABC transport system permease protein
MKAVRTALRGGLAGRRLQALLIGLVVLASAAASTLAAGLLVDSSAPFDQAFAAQHGADAALTVNSLTRNGRRVPAAELAATARLAGVTAAAGPFAEATVPATIAPPSGPASALPALRLAARSSPGGPVDDIVLSAGHWPTATGQVVISSTLTEPGSALARMGDVITLTGMPGSPKLTVVGVGTSVTGTADGWVLPAQMTTLGPPQAEQMLYRFASAGSAAAVNADVAAVRRALPAGTVAGAPLSWLTVKALQTQKIAPWVPFLVTFGLIGLVMSVLIVVNVVSGAVVADTRRIGVLKSVGFTPAQVVAVYVLQVAVPAVTGVVLGAVIANLLAAPLLGRTAQVLGVSAQSIPLWVDLAVPLAMLAVAGIAALVPASGAGRLSAVQAIAAGRAPRPAHGYAALRLLGRARVLPRPVTIGLAAPFARPARTLVTLAAILFGAVAVTFGVGLGSSLNRVATETSLPDEQVQVAMPRQSVSGSVPSVAAAEAAVTAALRAQPGTLHYVAESDDQLPVADVAATASVTAFGGAASWIGYSLTAGHWYGTGGAVVSTAFLNATGTRVGDTFTLTGDGRSVTLTITGEVFHPGTSAMVLTNLSSVSALDPSGLSPVQYDVGLRPGVNAQSYANALSTRLGPDYATGTSGSGHLLQIINGLVAILTLILVAVAGLGVLNTVVLMTRERVHDLGVFKAVGMTPRQTIAMVVTTVAATGLIAGLLAVPAAIALQHAILPVMGNAAQTAMPASVLNVYNPAELVLLALAGLIIAVASALAPASWAARTRTALALRAE